MLLENRGHKEFKAHKEFRVPRVIRVTKEILAPLVLKVQKVTHLLMMISLLNSLKD